MVSFVRISHHRGDRIVLTGRWMNLVRARLVSGRTGVQGRNLSAQDEGTLPSHLSNICPLHREVFLDSGHSNKSVSHLQNMEINL
jgi:hypothetical protein